MDTLAQHKDLVSITRTGCSYSLVWVEEAEYMCVLYVSSSWYDKDCTKL